MPRNALPRVVAIAAKVARSGDGGGKAGQPERADCRFLDVAVLPGGLVPAPGETAPDRQRFALVEREHDQQDDGQIEQGEHGDRDGAEARHAIDDEWLGPCRHDRP